MQLRSQKNIAARIMKCGKNRVWLSPSRMADISEAITARDINKLIQEGAIKSIQKKGISSWKKKKMMQQKRKGRRKGRGSRKGSIGTRMPRKVLWVKRIRKMRITLRELRDTKKIDKKMYRSLYAMAGGGFFRNNSHLVTYMEKEKIVTLKKEAKKLSSKKKKIKKASKNSENVKVK